MRRALAEFGPPFLFILAILGAVALFANYFGQKASAQLDSPLHRFVIACRVSGGTPWQTPDGSVGCYSGKGMQ